MAKNERYMKDIVLGLPAEAVEPVIQEFIRNNQFYRSEWHGDICWMTDYLNIQGYYFFKYSYDGTTLHIEAWLRNGRSGEMGLTGFTAATSKAPYLQKINQLSQRLIQLLPADSPYKAQAQVAHGAEEKALRKNKTVAYAALLCIACFLLVSFMFSAPSGNIITYLAAVIAIVGVIGMFNNIRKP